MQWKVNHWILTATLLLTKVPLIHVPDLLQFLHWNTLHRCCTSFIADGDIYGSEGQYHRYEEGDWDNDTNEHCDVHCFQNFDCFTTSYIAIVVRLLLQMVTSMGQKGSTTAMRRVTGMMTWMSISRMSHQDRPFLRAGLAAALTDTAMTTWAVMTMHSSPLRPPRPCKLQIRSVYTFRPFKNHAVEPLQKCNKN